MGYRPSRAIISKVKKYSEDYEIIRFERDQGAYIPQFVGGVAQPRESERVAIRGHWQPIGDGKLISSLPEGQRLEDVRKWWSTGSENVVKKKDKIVIDGAYFTVNGVLGWTNYTNVFIEADLLRTGETDNLD
jgi:hypothetical protein